jgi:hypothetical protein
MTVGLPRPHMANSATTHSPLACRVVRTGNAAQAQCWRCPIGHSPACRVDCLGPSGAQGWRRQLDNYHERMHGSAVICREVHPSVDQASCHHRHVFWRFCRIEHRFWASRNPTTLEHITAASAGVRTPITGPSKGL